MLKKKAKKNWKPKPLSTEEIDAIGVKKYQYVEGMTLKDLYKQYEIKAKEFTAVTGVSYMCMKNWWTDYKDDGNGFIVCNKAITLIMLFEGIAQSRRARILDEMKSL